MRFISLEGNGQRLDGGAMFGNCPRQLWERWAEPDAENRIRLACRALLVREPSGRNVLLEAGIGAFFPPKLRARFGVEESEHVLMRSLAAAGLEPSDIDVIVLSHLHFDHAGGLLSQWADGVPPSLAFPRAKYVVGARAWERARAPHPRDRASFIPELPSLLEGTGRLEVVPGQRSDTLGDRYTFTLSEGHTPGLVVTRVDDPSHGPVTFLSDLVPGAPWVHVPITMGYDRFPELLIDEKRAVLNRIREEEGWAFFTHDPSIAAAHVTIGGDGRFGTGDAAAAWS